MNRPLSQTLEMYLKTILQLEAEYSPVRISHISRARAVSAASVSEAVNTLRAKGYVLQRLHGDVRLSAKGRREATDIERRHDVLFGFLAGVLGVNERVAARDACEIEHVASRESLERLSVLSDYLEQAEKCKAGFLENFTEFRESREKKKNSDNSE